MIGGGRVAGRRHSRHGVLRMGGRFVTVHAGLSGIGLGERLANAMLGDGLGRREGSRGERRQEEH